MRITSLTYQASRLATVLCIAVVTVSLHAQKLYNLGGANILQTIDINTLEVTDLCQLQSVLSDIAFAPDGTLYGVEQHTLYRVDTVNGNLQVMKQFGASNGWLTGLTIDAFGKFYFSAAGAGAYHVLQYDANSDQVKDFGPLQWRHWDLEFFDGQLYASGGTDQVNEGFLISVDTTDLSNSTPLIQYGIQSYALSSFNDPCGGGRLVAPVLGAMLDLNTGQGSKDSIPLLDPLYTVSAGTASKTSWMGSFSDLVITDAFVGPLSCDADVTTYISVQVNSNRIGLVYSLDGGPFQASSRLEGVEIGTHLVSVRDTFGCIVTSDQIEIEVDFAPSGTISTEPASCELDNGSVEYFPANGGDYSYSLNGVNYQPTGIFTDLGSGPYVLYLINEFGCKAEVPFEVGRIPMVNHQLIATEEHCNQDDGTISVSAGGGVPPYNHSLGQMSWQNEPFFDGLHKATYLVRTRDSKGCVVSTAVTVDSVPAPQVFAVNIGDALCGIDNGSIEIVVDNSNDALLFKLAALNISNSSGLFDSLPPGAFDMTVSDTFGCSTLVSMVEVADITGPEITNVSTIKDDCIGDSGSLSIQAEGGTGELIYSLGNTSTSESDFQGLSAGLYTIAVTDENGCTATVEIEIEREQGARILDVQAVPTLCDLSNGEIHIITDSANVEFTLDGVDFQTIGSFTDIPTGSYSVYIRDEYGCTDARDIEVEATPKGEIIGVEVGDEECLSGNGWISIMSNGVDAEYWVNSVNLGASQIVDSLAEGIYRIVSKDENGCIDSTTTEVERLDLPLQYEVEVQDAECMRDDGKIRLNVEPSISTSINGGSFASDILYDRLESGMYKLALRDNRGCSTDLEVFVDTYGCGAFVPNVFTPNGDGVNDILEPVYDGEEYELLDFVVADRYGGIIFRCEAGCAWDGTSAGQTVLPGVYTYRIHMKSVYGETVLETGDITVLY